MNAAIDMALHTSLSLGISFKILGASKAKLRPKCLSYLWSEEWKGGTVRYRQSG